MSHCSKMLSWKFIISLILAFLCTRRPPLKPQLTELLYLLMKSSINKNIDTNKTLIITVFLQGTCLKGQFHVDVHVVLMGRLPSGQMLQWLVKCWGLQSRFE